MKNSTYPVFPLNSTDYANRVYILFFIFILIATFFSSHNFISISDICIIGILIYLGISAHKIFETTPPEGISLHRYRISLLRPIISVFLPSIILSGILFFTFGSTSLLEQTVLFHLPLFLAYLFSYFHLQALRKITLGIVVCLLSLNILLESQPFDQHHAGLFQTTIPLNTLPLEIHLSTNGYSYEDTFSFSQNASLDSSLIITGTSHIPSDSFTFRHSTTATKQVLSVTHFGTSALSTYSDSGMSFRKGTVNIALNTPFTLVIDEYYSPEILNNTPQLTQVIKKEAFLKLSENTKIKDLDEYLYPKQQRITYNFFDGLPAPIRTTIQGNIVPIFTLPDNTSYNISSNTEIPMSVFCKTQKVKEINSNKSSTSGSLLHLELQDVPYVLVQSKSC